MSCGRIILIIGAVLVDRHGETYTFSETTDPADIGRLYRLIYKENFPQQDRQDHIVGELCYRVMSRSVVFIDAVVVTARLKSSGLGATTVLTHFYLPGFFLRLGFRLDKKWGALAKTIGT